MADVAVRADTVRKRERLLSIQVMRGIAAMTVAMFHTSLIMSQREYGGLHAFEGLTSRGWAGVNLFFVLSGFIITHAHIDDIGNPHRLGPYLWRRFSRVYPIYWPVLTAFIAAALAGFGNMKFTTDLPNLLTSYGLIQLVAEPTLPLKVAWTLLHEIRFYAVFLLLIINVKLGSAAFAGWLTAILVDSIIFRHNASGWTSVWSVNFFMGGVAYLAVCKVHPRWGLSLLALGLAMLVALLAMGMVPDRPDKIQAEPLKMILLSLPLMMIIAASVMTEKAFAFPVPKLLVLLGNASYSIYLVHSAAISLFCFIDHKLIPGVIPAPVLFGIISVGAIFTGVMTHLLVERPILRLFRIPERWCWFRQTGLARLG